MGEIRDTAIIDALRRQMSIAAAKQVVAAGNLANVNTPGYRARAVDFTAALEQQLGGSISLTGTSESHLQGKVSEAVGTEEADGLPMRRDGNNVQLDRELLDMTRAAGDFSAAQTALAAKIPPRSIRHQRGSLIMSSLAAINASASALDAERARMEVAVSNLANAESTRGADGSRTAGATWCWRRPAATFEAALGAGAVGVQVAEIVEDQTPSAATSRRIPMRIPRAVAMPNMDPRKRWSTWCPPRAPTRPISRPSTSFATRSAVAGARAK